VGIKGPPRSPLSFAASEQEDHAAATAAHGGLGRRRPRAGPRGRGRGGRSVDLSKLLFDSASLQSLRWMFTAD